MDLFTETNNILGLHVVYISYWKEGYLGYSFENYRPTMGQTILNFRISKQVLQEDETKQTSAQL